MLDRLLLDGEFFERLEREDEEIARRVAKAGCRCGGRLYRSDYLRKPRGALLAGAAEEFVKRFSLCCGREGCRSRSTPPSLRFLGRRVYVGAVVIAASMVALMIERASALRRATGVPARTVRRWRSYWRTSFTRTEVFVAAAARLVGLDVEQLPTSIVERMPGGAAEQIARTLELLAPITTGSVPDGARFLRG